MEAILYSFYTLFSNSPVRARSALSRKLFSLWMAWAKIFCTILVLLLSAPEQHQGADQRVYERNSIRSGLKFLAESKVTQFWEDEVRWSMYMGMFSYHDSYPLFGWVHEWVLLGAYYFGADQKWMSYWKGYKFTRAGWELDGSLCTTCGSCHLAHALRDLPMLPVCSSVMIGEYPVQTRLVN